MEQQLEHLINIFHHAILPKLEIYTYESSRIKRMQDPNPLVRAGLTCYSQTDEDGITLEILSRLDDLKNRTFIEFGCGNGIENNSLILSFLDWRGVWVGADDLAWNYRENDRLLYTKEWISLDTLPGIIEKAKHWLEKEIDFVSLDLDGNDLHFAKNILDLGVRPALFIVEYNAKFPPPIEFTIPYDPNHHWQFDDYFGASLTSFNKMFQEQGYFLAACNSQTGSNAFFIDKKYEGRFTDCPKNIRDLYQPPRYFLRNTHGYANISIRTIESVIYKPL